MTRHTPIPAARSPEGVGSAGFTPGPWYCSHNLASGEFSVRQLSAIPTLPGKRVALTEANARLIAAAPELYEALERARSMLCCSVAATDSTMRPLYNSEERAERIAQISAALAKARGGA